MEKNRGSRFPVVEAFMPFLGLHSTSLQPDLSSGDGGMRKLSSAYSPCKEQATIPSVYSGPWNVQLPTLSPRHSPGNISAVLFLTSVSSREHSIISCPPPPTTFEYLITKLAHLVLQRILPMLLCFLHGNGPFGHGVTRGIVWQPHCIYSLTREPSLDFKKFPGFV